VAGLLAPGGKTLSILDCRGGHLIAIMTTLVVREHPASRIMFELQ